MCFLFCSLKDSNCIPGQRTQHGFYKTAVWGHPTLTQNKFYAEAFILLDATVAEISKKWVIKMGHGKVNCWVIESMKAR